MAGPFGTPDQSQAIAPAQQTGGFTPTNDNAVVDALAQGITQVGGVVRDKFQQEVEQEVQNQTKSLELALLAKSHPQFAESLAAEMAKDDPVVRGFLDETIGLEKAMKQRILPQQYALQRLRVLEQNAIQAAPEFADEIRAAARDLTGRNPDRDIFAIAFQGSDPNALTPAEKAAQQAEVKIQEQMILTNSTREQVIERGLVRAEAEAEANRLKLVTSKGERLFENVERLAINQMGSIREDFFQEMNTALKSGGVLEPAVMAVRYRQKAEGVKAELARNLPKGADASVLNDQYAKIDAELAWMLPMIEDGSLLSLAKDQSGALVAGVRQNMLRTNPRFLLAYAHSPNDVVRALEYLDAAGDTEASQRIGRYISPQVDALLQTQAGVDQFLKVYGEAVGGPNSGIIPIPTTEDEKRIHAAALTIAMQSEKADVQGKALSAMLDSHGEDVTWAALGNREVFLNVNAKEHGGAVENLQRTQLEALKQEYAALVGSPNFDPSRFGFRDGQLFVGGVASPTSIGRLDPRSQAIDSENQAMYGWVKKYNRWARISKMYKDGGKMNASLFSGSEQEFNTIVNAFRETAEQSQPQVVMWEKDENGVPRPVVNN